MVDLCILNVKIYHKLHHDIIFVLSRETLDDMPQTVQTIHTQLEQLEIMSYTLEMMDTKQYHQYLLDLRLEHTICFDKVVDGHPFLSKLDVFWFEGIEILLGGYFDMHINTMDDLFKDFKDCLQELEQDVHGANETTLIFGWEVV